MARDVRRIAEIMHAGRPAPESTGIAAMDAAMRAIDKAAIDAYSGYLERMDRQRRATIDACARTPRLLFRLPFFRLAATPPLSASDAFARAIGEYRRQRGKARDHHWSHDAGLMAEAWEMAVIARYFRRYGKEIWMREAA